MSFGEEISKFYCCNCDGIITTEQVVKAMQDSSCIGMNELALCCSTYTDEHGCRGNEPDDMPYWYTV